ncbi:MAG: alanine racemase [Chloroflexi bacterium]|nr:alanine racemase [Chloroflexota bacterium]
MIPDAAGVIAVASEHGTPAYVHDLDEMARRIGALRRALPDRVDLAYAVKANPAIAVIGVAAAEGLGADVMSVGELDAAVRAGIEPASIVYTGPGKRDAELAESVERGIGAITLESLGELERLRGICREARRRQAVLVRAAGEPRPDNVIGTGHGRFGMRESDLLAAARAVAAAPELDLIGVHRFDATNVLDHRKLLATWNRSIEIAARVARASATPLRLVDLGGGLGIPYEDGEAPLDLRGLGAGLEALVATLDADTMLAGARLLLEPGRHLVGPCGAYVVRVIDVKVADEGTVVTVDGGVHHLLRPALVGGQHRIVSLAPDAVARRTAQAIVGGPLCTSLDVLGQVTLPEPRVGDLLAVTDAGAYGYTESMPLFGSHPSPLEIVLQGGEARVIRDRINPAVFIDQQAGSPGGLSYRSWENR